MTNQRHISKPPNRLLWLLFCLVMLKSALAADLVFDPATPTVVVGQQITLSVSGTSGEIIWTPSKGQIQGTGNQVTYLAPMGAGLDSVMVLDSAGNLGAIKITVTAKQLVSLENANWEVFTNRNKINAILLSDNGKTLWVGTMGGLEQRDASTGKLVRVFTNLEGLPSNEISVLESDGSGGLWIGTSNGLANRSVNGEWAVYTTDNSRLPSNDITALESDGSGGLWIGTSNGLANRSVKGEWVVYKIDNSGFLDNEINALESDGSGELWVGIFNGIANRTINGEWAVYTTYDLGLSSNRFDALESDGSGGLWIGTTYEGLGKLSVKGEWRFVDTKENSGLPGKGIIALESDGSGGLWIGTPFGGLANRSVNGEWAVYTTDNSGLPDNWINTLESDGSGGLWIGTDEGLANRSVNGEWAVYTTDNSGLPDNRNRINGLENDGSGGLWIGTSNGLANRSVNGKWALYTTDNSGLPDKWINALESDGSGGLWIGTRSDGLANRSINGEWAVYTKNNSVLPDNLVFDLESDGKGGLWIATYGGTLANRSVNGEWALYEWTNYIWGGISEINALESDGSGGLWIGTSGGGLLNRNVNGEWVVYTTYNSELPDNNINALESNGSAGLWIGTSGGLANRNLNGEWAVYTTDNSGLSDNRVSSLKSDGSGGLWIGNAGGLANRSINGEWIVYTTYNSGLPSNFISALKSDGNNGLWIGTYGNGLAHLTFSQKNTLCTDLNDADCQNVLTDKRAAILIHPRGQGSGLTQALSIERMSAHIYRTLQNRGYDNDEIYFLSHKPDVDINGDGMVDRNVVDAPVKSFDKVTPRDLTHADVQQAFDWAKQKGQLDQPLLVIFVDHALTGQLRLDPFTEVLTAQDLNTLLTDYQQATGSEVVVILEACHTGSLVNGLAGPNRLIITSAAENQAYYENLGMFSFSKFFFDNLRRGESFYDAFQTVKGKLPTYGHPFNQQIPQLDDDGDGLANNSTDGRLAQKWCLNGCFGALSGEITLEPETVSGPVTAGQTTPLLVRAGITEGRIKRVWALVMTPEAAEQRNQEGFSLIPTPVVNLTQKADDPSRWQGTFSGFQYRGDYVVTFMAEDNEGFITTAAPIVFTQAEGPEVPEFIAGPDPIPSQTVYQAGEQLRLTLPALPADQKQYIAVSYPDQSLYFMTGLNGFVLFDGRSVPVWEDSGKVAIDQPVTAFPKGEYIVYLLRLPAWIDLLSHPEEWRIGFSTFRVE
jgi:ligand-binding sensor domain-containing protein